MDKAKQMVSFWLTNYYGNKYILGLTVIAAIYILICNCKYRRKLIYPIIVALICIVNPLLYKYIFSKIIYWRLLWIITDDIIIAYALVDIIKKLNKNIEKVSITILLLGIIVVCGSYAYREENYEKVKNVYGISQTTIDICDVMLEEKSNPKCILPGALYTEARQYSPDIIMLYGRNAEGYISSVDEDLWLVNHQIVSEQPDYYYVFSKANENHCDFVVITQKKTVDKNIIDRYEYELLEQLDGYNLYYKKEWK